jgi:hypothetical protein
MVIPELRNFLGRAIAELNTYRMHRKVYIVHDEYRKREGSWRAMT